ncbi:hypothetical protein AUK10_01270 [Candidatus Gracilibacteria bacterium CG2_30_37_12]|nr:MAG: hypothetical protein AUK10_01270 [Candidatus Gracilibacteria bacterium CG2_30_37_12]
MRFVDGIKDPKKISQIKNILRDNGDYRNLLLFSLGINAALRIQDLLSLQVKHLFEEDLTIREFFDIKEMNTGKSNRIFITPKVRVILGEYAEKYPHIVENAENYVFFRKKSFPLGSKPIGRKMAWLFLSGICKDVGLKGSYGTHTLRKTFGWMARTNNVGIELIQKRLNHGSLTTTMAYLGITNDEMKAACDRLDL